MAGQQAGDGAGTSWSSGPGSDSVVDLNVKTLDSQIFTFHTEKIMSVASFKEKIAHEIGLPVAQQRLIFRGKVLKDEELLSEYHVENGHTLHLVERQPAQPQSSSSSSFGETNANTTVQGNSTSAGVPHNHIGQIAHSVLMGSFNVGDQPENVVPDLTRVVGAVMNSLGFNDQNAANLPQSVTVPHASGQAPRCNETEAALGDGSQTQAVNQSQSRQPSPDISFPVPLAGASIPLSSVNPIPDSLNTMVEFMNQMEGVLLRNGRQQDQSISDFNSQPQVPFPSNSEGLPMPEALSVVLRHAERLVNGGAVGSLSHIAGRLEHESRLNDPSVRSQLQSELVQAGLAMQHLGTLFLELGRVILTLQMGQSPAESAINAGPAVYISPLGPNPIMVQPFPLQTSPLFNNASNSSPSPGPIGTIGSAPRHVNIHIHAGAAPVGARAGTAGGIGEGTQGEHAGGTISRPTTVGVSSTQPVIGVSSLQPANSASLSSVLSEINSQLQNLASSRTGHQPSSGQQQNLSVQLDRGSDVQASVLTREGNIPGTQAEMAQYESRMSGNDRSIVNSEPPRSMDASSSSSGGQVRFKYENAFGDISKSADTSGKPDVPLGLGLGGSLQPKRRARQPQDQLNGRKVGPSGAVSSYQNSNAIPAGQQVLQSLASLGRSIPTVQSPAPSSQGLVNSTASVSSGQNRQVSAGQPDMMGMMSQVLNDPAFGSILSGVAGQAGGSTDDMRIMFQQLSQNPETMNTINQFAQQMSIEDLPNLLAGSGKGQGGSLDLSGMIQQMMPVVSRAISGSNSNQAELFATVGRDTQSGYANKRPPREQGTRVDQTSQINVQEVVQRITQQGPPQDILGAVVQNSLQLIGGSDLGGLVDEIRGDEELAESFMETLCHDLRKRLHGGSSGSS